MKDKDKNKDSFWRGFFTALVGGLLTFIFTIASDDEEFVRGLNTGMWVNTGVIAIALITLLVLMS